nr:ATP-binding cassette domain-containing protein [Nocardioides convexus]
MLLNTIIGMYPPEKGQIYVDGEPIVGMRHRDLMRVRRKFGVLFQDGALFGSISLYDNIAFPLREHTDLTEAQVREVVHTKADMVGLVKHLDKMPGEVSGGMKKRAGLARALALEPEIVFFDEPDSGLDPVRVAHLDEPDAGGPGGHRLHLLRHHPQHRLGQAHGRPHRDAVPLPPGRLRPRRRGAVQRPADRRAVLRRARPRSDRHGRDGRRRGGSRPRDQRRRLHRRLSHHRVCRRTRPPVCPAHAPTRERT